MLNKIKAKLLIFYIKFIKGQCRHICGKCEYKDMCYEHFIYEHEDFFN